ncbi:BMC domain-containing protein [Sporomusa malonica]|uniref:BMC domain-containing protein n=1 Tax=Sporomusa malonica TaxID=112901 RepID=A0A1W1YEQ3_9FIRM|nr:BMC domain-containing protein [Sporomusa malonica]SMC34635.1 BMC domain-containing protein [Sporomusa malonica]
MVKNALGLIEVVGLAAGMEAADAAIKAANVELLGYELTKGGGMVVIKLCGDVGAVKAAVDAGAAAASKVNKVFSTHVIPRPHHELGAIVITKETVGRKQADPAPVEASPQCEQSAPAETVTLVEPESTVQAEESPDIEPAAEAEIKEEPVLTVNPAEICNLCGDPACSRKKGDPRVTCIHYDKNKEDE